MYEIDANYTLVPNPRFPPGQCIDHIDEWHRTGIDVYAAVNAKYPPITSSEAEDQFIASAVANALKVGPLAAMAECA